MKKRLISTIVVFCAIVLSTFASQSASIQDQEKALDSAIIAPTDWDSLDVIDMPDDCGSEQKSESCASSFPKPQTTSEGRAVIISDECNSKVKVLAAYRPCYPVIAKSAHASGTVKVMVVVDESGQVTWARAWRGHPLLQFAAVRAACKWRFEPARCGSVNRMISFNFVKVE